jgi:hypothetical protein
MPPFSFANNSSVKNINSEISFIILPYLLCLVYLPFLCYLEHFGVSVL